MAVFSKVKSESLKDKVVSQLEEFILSGQLAVGQKLPPERELAVMLGVGRPLVHEALVECEARDLVSRKPRSGTVVNDYRIHGSLSMLEALVRYNKGKLDPSIFEGLIEFRTLVEVEIVRVAALNRTKKDIVALAEIIDKEKVADRSNPDALTALDFSFHLTLGVASQNFIYPLVFNSFISFYTSLSGIYYQEGHSPDTVFALHKKIFDAVVKKSPNAAEKPMREAISLGVSVLRPALKKKWGTEQSGKKKGKK